MSGKRVTKQPKSVKDNRTAYSQGNTSTERPPRTVSQLVTAHDVQLYKLTRAYAALAERMSQYEKRLQDNEELVPAEPTFEEEETDLSGGAPLEVVVEES